MTATDLDLTQLTTGDTPAISAAIGSAMAEAAGFCLESAGHQPGTTLRVRGDADERFRLIWEIAGTLAERAWDPFDATEWGAAGIAVLIAKRVTRYEVVQRSRRGTGIDYWLGERDRITFQRKARLEVSGILRGDASTLRARVREKVRQTRKSDPAGQRLPAFVIVVEFSAPIAEVLQR